MIQPKFHRRPRQSAKIPVVVKYPDGSLDPCTEDIPTGILRGFFPAIEEAWCMESAQDNYSVGRVTISLQDSYYAYGLAQMLKYAQRTIIANRGRLGGFGPVKNKPFYTYLCVGHATFAFGLSSHVAEITGRSNSLLYNNACARGRCETFKIQISDLKHVYGMNLGKNHPIRYAILRSLAAALLDGKVVRKRVLAPFLEERKDIADEITVLQNSPKQGETG